MKYVIITFLACVAVVIANPININNNRIGDVVSVNLDVNAVLSSSIEQNIISGILALVNQQAVVVEGSQLADKPVADTQEDTLPADLPALPQIPLSISPELIEKLKEKFNLIH